MQICSFLPAATEILYALGLGESVAGVTFECDYPPEARKKPVVLDTVLAHSLTAAEVDRTVHEFSTHGESLYRVQTDLLRKIRPDLIVTQELCDVCAVDKSEVAKALHELPSAPKIVSLTPHTLEDVWRDIEVVGEATNRQEQAKQLVAELRKRVEHVKQYSYTHRPRVLSLEWLSPPFNGGHWVPEMVALAGGTDALGRPGEKSRRLEPREVVKASPDVAVLMPCGFDLARTRKEAPVVTSTDWWTDLPAARADRVWIVDGSSYFNRPGPRLVDGLKILAHIVQPDLFSNPPDAAAAARVS